MLLSLLEVFQVIFHHIGHSNNFGHQSKEKGASVDISITEMREAVFIFNKMNVEGVIVARDDLLKKSLGTAL